MSLFRQASFRITGVIATIFIVAGFYSAANAQAPPAPNPQSGAIGVGGQVDSDPPTSPAVITVPTSGQTFNRLPITVAGLCQSGLLVEILKNNVFAGAVQCAGGSFSLQIDLFDGRNDLVARVYDNLNQAGPDSNVVTVNFSAALPGSGPRVSITTEYAKRGANPGETLTWPITISGGSPPYAVSVDWGDGSAPDLISRPGAGNLTIEHVYELSGVYNVVVKVTDSAGDAAFLQVVGVGNGPIQQTSADGKDQQTSGSEKKTILWWPLIPAFGLALAAFWLGQRHQLEVIRDRLRRGERPFK